MTTNNALPFALKREPLGDESERSHPDAYPSIKYSYSYFSHHNKPLFVMEEKQDTIGESTNKSEKGELEGEQEEIGGQEQVNEEEAVVQPEPMAEPFMRRVRRPIKKPEEPPKEESKQLPPPLKKPNKDKEKLGDLPILLREIREHQLFRDWVQKFWSLLQISSYNRAPRSEIRRLLHRIYKLLRPRYNETAIDQEISYTLGYYMANEDKADLKMFTRILFDTIHIWAPNVDLIEYISYLKCIYTRIINTVIHKPEGVKKCPIKVTVTFPEDEEKVNQRLKDGEPQWLPCKMDEVEDDDWEYTFNQDPNDANKYEKLKRPKQQVQKGFGRAQNGFVVQENWEFVIEGDHTIKVEEKLADTEAVLPLGYIAELFLAQIKNKKEEEKEENALLIDDIIIRNAIRQKMTNSSKVIPITMLGIEKVNVNIEAQAEIGEIVEQVLNYNIKSENEHILTVKVALLENIDELTQLYTIPKGLNLKNNYSTGLKRRLFFEQLNVNKELEWVNINYTLERHDILWAIENHISLKPDNKNLVLTEEEGSSLEKFAKGKSDTHSAPYLNSIELPKFLQIVLGQKQIAIRKELKYMKSEEPVEVIKEVKDPLHKFTSFRNIKKDSYTSDLSIIDYAKQDVSFVFDYSHSQY